MTRRLSPLAFSFGALLTSPLLLKSAVFAEQSEHAAAKPAVAQYLGTGSCSSSNCHGSVAPIKSSNIFQNEYVTWQRHDKHSQAYKVLGNQDSQTIAKHLGIGDPQRGPLCLKCHTTYVREVEQRGEKYQIEDGVTCESCHGPAGEWIKTHTEKGTTHEKNVQDGLASLVGLNERTQLCVSCHHGNDDKTVDHRLIGAGHPRLSFELDTFESIMPRHWKVDEDYRNRKGDYRSGSAWLRGQTALAKESMNILLSKKRSMNGIFPEFTTFNCYSCHHNLTGDQWKSRDYGKGVGEPTLNLASLQMIKLALQVEDPKAGQQLNTLMAGLHEQYKVGKAEKSIKDILKLLDRPVLAKADLSLGNRNKLVSSLATYGSTTPFLPYETAEQIAMGISSLVAEDQDKAAALKQDLDTMFKALAEEESFAPEKFTSAAKRIRDRVGR